MTSGFTMGPRSSRNADWIERYCHVPEGKLVGQRVQLTREQLRWLVMIYDSPTRMFLCSMARKNGKTAFIAMLMLLHLAGPESTENSQLYSAAQSKEQAATLFKLAAKMVRKSPDLRAFVKVRDTVKELECAERGTVYKALSSDAPTAHGLSPKFAVHDELGQVRGPKSDLFDAIETGMGAHDEPLSIVISTQAPTDADLLSLLLDDAERGADPMTKCVLYTAPMDADPWSEETIRAANPHYDIFMNRDEVKRKASEAQRMPSAESRYRNLNLNQRISETSSIISKAVFDRGNAAPDPKVLGTRPVYAGLDLSSRLDLTALVIGAQDDAGTWHVRCEFFAPEEGVEERSRRDKVPYDIWAKQGFLTLTPGQSVDYAFVAHKLCAIADDCDLRAVAFDRWKIDALKKELAALERELPLVPFGQGFKDMAPAVDAVEAAFVGGKVRHGDNPILRMCAANTKATLDPAGNRKLDKKKSTGRIDGFVALTMLVGHASVAAAEQEPNYDIHWI